MSKLQVGIIGYKNHANRVRKLIETDKRIDRIYVYHPDKEKLETTSYESKYCEIVPTNEFSQIHDCAAAFICSPSETHKDYIENLIDLRPFIFCEKPIGTSYEELDWLMSLSKKRKKRVYCNQNYGQTNFSIEARNLILSGKAGKPIHLEVSATHGLSYKNRSKENWRFKRAEAFSSIVGNLGVHYIHMAMMLFGDIVEANCEKLRCNPESVDADTCLIVLRSQHGQTASIHLSYSAPYTNSAKLLLTDGILEMEDGILKIYRPRESYDKDGRFTTPTSKTLSKHTASKKYYDESLVRSLNHFLKTVCSGDGFTLREFKMSIESARLALNLFGRERAFDVSDPQIIL